MFVQHAVGEEIEQARRQLGGAALDVSTEFEQLQGKVGQSVPVVGFYAYGEIGPLERGGASKFHNQSIVSVALG